MCEITRLVRVLVSPATRKIDELVPGYVHVDACIADVVARLNELGIRTLGSCCARGHTAPFPEAWIAIEAGDESRVILAGYTPRPARFRAHPGAIEVDPFEQVDTGTPG